jgi:regulator of ribonuclease activity B
MRPALVGVLLSSAIASCSRDKPDRVTAPSCIDEKLVASLFKEMRRKGAWDLEEPLLWAYYFEDRQQAPLVALRDWLERDGYQFVELLEPERQGDQYVLHVSRVERHSVESMNARNRKLCGLAKMLKVDRYKGMDVGPISEERR